jgi:DNA-binding transcriptional ArsR family regulator
MTDKPEAGMPGNPITLTDPKMMRAMAHPARIAILTHLVLSGAATATECAEVAGLSPSACSYHLRTLARYGIIEEDPDSAPDGRQRPWRARIISFSIETDSKTPPAVALASEVLVESIRADIEETRARYRQRRLEYPDQWRHALGETQDVVHVSPEELNELREQFSELVSSYRRLKPDERPAGTLPVRLLLEAFPWFGPEEVK